MGLNEKPKGLGDTVENILESTGIAKVVKSVIKTCNCGKRRDYLNKIVPYKNTKK
jgi:hypothetical protein